MEIDLGNDIWTDTLLENGGFEYWDDDLPRDWTAEVTGASTIIRSPVAYLGNFSCRAWVASGQLAEVKQAYSFTKGKLYKLVMWLRMTSVLPVRVSTYEGVPAGSISVQVTPSLANTWFRYYKVFRANAYDTMVKIENNSSNYFFYVDGVQLYALEPQQIELT